LRPERSGNLFEMFFIVGIGPKENVSTIQPDVYDPQILFKYPSEAPSKTIEKSLSDICFPHGVHTEIIRRTRSFSAGNSILFGALNELQDSNRSFVTLLTGSDQLLYAICVKDNDFVNELPSLMGPNYEEKHQESEPPTIRAATSPTIPVNTRIPTPKTVERKPTKRGVRTLAVAPRCYVLITRFPFF